MRLPDIPVPIQTLWAELVHKAWVSNLSSLTVAAGGSAYATEIKGRRYWYWQAAGSRNGVRPKALYLGADNTETRRKISDLQESVGAVRERRDMVRALRTARLPYPDPISGDIMAALADAGIFRLRATVVGTYAFQTYSGMLGWRMPAGASQTGDLDISQFRSISIAVPDQIEETLESVLRRVDKRFEAIPSPLDTRRTMRYALRVNGEENFSVDVISPMRGPEREKIEHLPALRTDAQSLRYLDFLIYHEIDSVALHGNGIPIKVPDPTRYALHKLLVAQMRNQGNARSAAKARKDLAQAGALISVLMHARPGDLEDYWQELCERGPKWRKMAMASLVQMQETTGLILPDWMAATAEEFREDEVDQTAMEGLSTNDPSLTGR